MSKYLTAWQIGIRKKGKDAFPKGDHFVPIPNSFRFWAADPFVFEQKTDKGTVVYIFAELYDYFHGKGTIGYCTINADGSFSKWKQVIREPWHLSFPNIYLFFGEIYIIPESYQKKELYVYRAVKFPDVWEKCHILCGDIVCTDTVFLKNSDRVFGITLENGTDMRVFSVADGKTSEFRTITNDLRLSRNAGKIILQNNKMYRVIQDCSETYGKRIGFAEIIKIDEVSYEEKFLFWVSYEDIEVQKIDKSIIKGIHTYNCSEYYECIDWKYDDHSILGYATQLFKNTYHVVKNLCYR